MTKSAVRALLGKPDSEFVANKYSPYMEWAYRQKGVIVSFDRRARCVALMFSHPSSPRLGTVRLLNIPGRDAWRVLRRLDTNAEADDNDSLTSTSMGISIYSPHLDERPYSVLVFRSDYYD